MSLIAVLIDEDGDNLLDTYGPFPSYDAVHKWNEEFLRHSGIKYWRYEILRLVGVTEDKG